MKVTHQRFHAESRMRENGTLRLCYATASQAGSMRNSRPKTAKSVLRVAEGQAGVPDNKRRSALLYTPWKARRGDFRSTLNLSMSGEASDTLEELVESIMGEFKV